VLDTQSYAVVEIRSPFKILEILKISEILKVPGWFNTHFVEMGWIYSFVYNFEYESVFLSWCQKNQFGSSKVMSLHFVATQQ